MTTRIQCVCVYLVPLIFPLSKGIAVPQLHWTFQMTQGTGLESLYTEERLSEFLNMPESTTLKEAMVGERDEEQQKQTNESEG